MEALLLSVCTAIVQHFSQHMKAYGSAFGLFAFVTISNMPKPGVKWTKLVLYTWMYDTVQTVLPINRALHNQLQMPTTVIQQLDAPKQEIPMPPRYGVK